MREIIGAQELMSERLVKLVLGRPRAGVMPMAHLQLGERLSPTADRTSYSRAQRSLCLMNFRLHAELYGHDVHTSCNWQLSRLRLADT